MGADNEIESATPQAVEYLERLGAEGAFMLPAVVVAVRFRYEGAAARVVRVRTEDGQWLVLRAGRWTAEENRPGSSSRSNPRSPVSSWL
ncbi:hypothetical protein LRS71_04890 [Rhodococcus pyridinivorans]|uniref:hypothetical protein n=1 Tax=Rhodococcus pyridinivorans TaxID=103816 RepID=UPI001E5A8BCF|nr:hypothetical protein [Rhodococcus pyridinivorans]MCD5418898.1 hypothetical protein [Rhodococcus pyridinivorans]